MVAFLLLARLLNSNENFLEPWVWMTTQRGLPHPLSLLSSFSYRHQLSLSLSLSLSHSPFSISRKLHFRPSLLKHSHTLPFSTRFISFCFFHMIPFSALYLASTRTQPPSHALTRTRTHSTTVTRTHTHSHALTHIGVVLYSLAFFII